MELSKFAMQVIWEGRAGGGGEGGMVICVIIVCKHSENDHGDIVLKGIIGVFNASHCSSYLSLTKTPPICNETHCSSYLSLTKTPPICNETM